MRAYNKIYDQKALEQDAEVNQGRPYQQCSLSVMDTIADPNITFDDKGICNYYYEYKTAEKDSYRGEEGKGIQRSFAERIKKAPGKHGYDCILGLSGGLDSTYLAVLAKELKLNPLLVHFDYGWNSEIAIKNVENAVEASGFDLHTIVMDWQEFKNLQRSYFKASVIDLDVPADHMIFGALYKVSKEFNIKYLLSGNNVWTEHTMPKTWNYNKVDLVNIQNIHKKFENTPLTKLPKFGIFQVAKYSALHKIERINFLDYEFIDRKEIEKIIEKEMGWINYGGKHQESVFTRFYQGYILPSKFNIDKRKAHYSNMIFSGQMTKEEAQDEISKPAYAEALMKQDFEYVAKKLGFTISEFEVILTQYNVPHEFYGTDAKIKQNYFKLMKIIKPVTKIIKKVMGK
jgi:N-acetyl sugar amidotransferase